MLELAQRELRLEGRGICLEPLGERHAEALTAAAAGNEELYRWTVVPQGREAMLAYIQKALAARAGGAAIPFVILRRADGAVLGATRLYDFDTWDWPPGHARHGRAAPDVCEIGYTWLGAAALRTAVNTEAKLLLLTHAFETWRVLRVCLKTDARNARSRAAIERIGGRFEGIWRAHMLASDGAVRDTARYSIVAEEWPPLKRRLEERLARTA